MAESTASDNRCFLIANHGLVSAGSDLASAADAAEELEETARLFLLLRDLSPRPLTRTQVAELNRRFPS